MSVSWLRSLSRPIDNAISRSFDDRPWSLSIVFLVCILYRVSTAWFLRTAFNPDEFFQNQEVAYATVYGRGLLTWEWLPNARIRSFLHPGMTACLYAFARFWGIDTPALILWGPRFVQAIFAAVGDVLTLKLALKWTCGDWRVAKWAIVGGCITWFSVFCAVRPFSNSLEAVLTVSALCDWDFTFERKKKNAPGAMTLPLVRSLLCMGAATLLRPPSASLWLLLALVYTLSLPKLVDRARFVSSCALVAAAVVAAGVAVDKVFYGDITLSWLSFFRYNFTYDIGVLYGTHPWHWMLTSALPTVLGALLPMAALGMWLVIRGAQREGPAPVGANTQVQGGISSQMTVPPLMCLVPCLWPALSHSVAAHKEFRFILATLPPWAVVCGTAFASLQRREVSSLSSQQQPASGTRADEAAPSVDGPVRRRRSARLSAAGHSGAADSEQSAAPKVPGTARAPVPGTPRVSRQLFSVLVTLLAVVSLGTVEYFGRWHQGGALAAVAATADRVRSLGVETSSPSQAHASVLVEPTVALLMPCHATPLYTAFHAQPIRTEKIPEVRVVASLRHLDCSPLLDPVSGAPVAAPGSPTLGWNSESETELLRADPLALALALYGLPPPYAGGQDGDDGGVGRKVLSRLLPTDPDALARVASGEDAGASEVAALSTAIARAAAVVGHRPASPPQFLLCFDTALPRLRPFLTAWGYRPLAGSPWFHSHFEDEKEAWAFELPAMEL